LGVVFGCALGSPAAYKYAFWCGGLAVAIAVVRAKPFKDKSTHVQASTTSLLWVGLAVVWLFLWHVIPRPAEPRPEPPTKEEIANAVLQKLELRAATPGPPTSLTVTDVKPKSTASSQPSSANQIADAIVAKLPKSPELAKRIELANLTNERLSEATKTTAKQLQSLVMEWKGRDENEYLSAYELHYLVPRPPQAEIDARMASAERDKAQRADSYRAKAKDAVALANDLRKQVLQRLAPWQKNKQDEDANAIFDKLVGGSYGPNDLLGGMGYLDVLGKRFSEMYAAR
jgi:hypothetical protein